MRGKLQQIALVMLGLVAGILVSVHYSAIAQREAIGQLPFLGSMPGAQQSAQHQLGLCARLEDMHRSAG